MTAIPLSETLGELNQLCQFFITAENLLKAGQTVDMTGIDSRVSVVCKNVQDSLPEQQQQYLPELTALISLLNSYETGLRSLHASLNDPKEEQHA